MPGTFQDRCSNPLAIQLTQLSPYLSSLLNQLPEFAERIRAGIPEELAGEIIAACHAASRAGSVDQLRRELRLAKARNALLIAICDLAGVWPVEEVTRRLTLFADAAVQATLDFHLLQAHTKGRIVLPDTASPSHGCAYVVLAMGKHGAFELNYSSDIDLIVLYDAEQNPLPDNVEPSQFYVRLTRDLVATLQDITEDGYVLRVDLRLRPDPRATQIAIAIEAAAIYYENLGQNWERAAMIKARPCAGDVALGHEFLDRLKPYIWRRYLDFAAIADVQSLKRQIHSVKGHGEIAIQGHNLKLGRGGIREIEFFVQTQQLIAGGRNPALRGNQTLAMLMELAKAGWISKDAAQELSDAYCTLRQLEHRVQMTNDMQDHCVPAAPEAFESFARFSGFADGAALAQALGATLQTVQRHYQALFEQAGELAGDEGSLVFTGGEDDPETIETLRNLGFREPSEVSATIRGWHFGRYNATRTKRSRELLTELMPQLLKAFSETGDADHAFIAFDSFLRKLPAGIQLFSMLKANPHLLDLIARVLGTAPRLAEKLSRQPRILEAVIDRAFFGPLPPLAELEGMATSLISAGIPLEEAMDRARVMGREQRFRVGVRILSETVSAAEAGSGYANVADVLLRRLHEAVIREMVEKHGSVSGGSSAIIAMGKLGGREMSATSDLDLILVYDFASGGETSDGPRPLSAQHYFARLTQRLIAAITSPTAEGVLYEVDMRLRPSGSKGPVAVSLSSFEAYQTDSAWTWERMALTRARVVSGPDDLRIKLDNAITKALTARRDPQVTLEDIRSMRSLMLREHPTALRWDLKGKRGGIVELEFIAQALMLVHAEQHPEVIRQNTLAAYEALQAAGVMEARIASPLIEAAKLYGALSQLLRVSMSETYDPATAPRALTESVCRVAGLPSLATVEALLDESAAVVAASFDKIIGISTP